MVLKELRAVLVADEDASALAGTRVYLAAIPEGAARPHILLTLTATDRLNTNTGADNWRRAVVEVACIAEKYSEVVTLGQAVASALEDFSAGPGGTISAVRPEGEYDAPNHDEAKTLFARVQLYEVTRNASM